MLTSTSTGTPFNRSASGCSHSRMFPRCTSFDGALWNAMTLGMCIRNATSSLPFQPTSPTCFAADGPTTCLILEQLAAPVGTGKSTRRTAPGATTGGCRRRRRGCARSGGRHVVTHGPT